MYKIQRKVKAAKDRKKDFTFGTVVIFPSFPGDQADYTIAEIQKK